MPKPPRVDRLAPPKTGSEIVRPDEAPHRELRDVLDPGAAARARNRAAFEARAALKKAATDYSAAILLGSAEVIAAAFAKLEEIARKYS